MPLVPKSPGPNVFDLPLALPTPGLPLDFASTQISQPVWRCLGHRNTGGILTLLKSAPAMYRERVRGLGIRGDLRWT